MALSSLVRCGAALLALAAAAAADARYADYSGVRMPAYSGGGDYAEPREPALEPDDYRGHSPDAPAALDYKDDDDFKGKTDPPGTITRDVNSWQTVPRKSKKIKKPSEDLRIDEGGFDPVDDIPKIKSNSRLTKHRSRLKSRKFDKDDDESSKYALRHSRDRRGQDDVFDNREDSTNNKEDFQDSVKSYENDKRHEFRTTSERVARRRPRDRYVKRELEESDEKIEAEVDRELEAWQARELTSDMYMTGQPPARAHGAISGGDDRLAMLRPRPALPGGRPPPPGPPAMHAPPIRPRDDEYGDYYDMKRVMNMKNRLTTHPRRTQAWDVRDSFGRRQFTEQISGIAPEPVTSASHSPEFTSGFRYSPYEVSVRPKLDITTSATTIEDISTTTTSTPTTTTLKPVQEKVTAKDLSKELSLAEKSRLSILKKAQRKESVRSEVSTVKPPVLLQVKQKLATVVMVEPPTSEQPWMRAREVFVDTPQRLEKVKRLMRHKLVANARSIHDLTDNWDDLVCDYIDMSLIDRSATTSLEVDSPLFMTIVQISLIPVFIGVRLY